MIEINSQAVASLVLMLSNTDSLTLSYSTIMFSSLLLSVRDNWKRSFKLKSFDTNSSILLL